MEGHYVKTLLSVAFMGLMAFMGLAVAGSGSVWAWPLFLMAWGYAAVFGWCAVYWSTHT